MNNWAIIGLGYISPRHILAIENIGGKITVACDIDKNVKVPEGVYLSDDYKKLPLDKFENVAICTPNNLHVEMAKYFNDNGKKVLCEKPLGISISEVEKIKNTDIKTVLQLRYHPKIKELFQRGGSMPKNVVLNVSMYREPSYWNSWKANEKQSGGILFNLGIHYLDLLIHLLGDKYEIKSVVVNEKLAFGKINFRDTEVLFDFNILDSREGQGREMIWDGESVKLSDKDNLSMEGLHLSVYKDFIGGKGISVEEALKSIKLAEKLKKQ